MSPHAIGILIGGLLPAILFSITNLSTKAVSNAGIGVGWYVVFAGAGVTIMGGILLFLFPERMISAKYALFSGFAGFAWGLGIGCIVIALNKFGNPIGVLTPLFNLNTLITVLVALWIFAEWKQVKIPQLLIGSVLIVVGGVFVARA